MSNMKDLLKNKVKGEKKSAHDLLMEPANVNVNVNENVNIKKKRREKFEDKFARATFYIENGLLEKINAEAGNEKGEKTRIINEALRQYFNSG
ncbi:hypothetical protein [Marinicrinis lubricantis]|uniref:CopG family transcriptional regulator n=1 Tax=Marinicrinis lubricantis TaxID=2086470 RepID=A0ABW1IN22_9BACL